MGKTTKTAKTQKKTPAKAKAPAKSAKAPTAKPPAAKAPAPKGAATKAPPAKAPAKPVVKAAKEPAAKETKVSKKAPAGKVATGKPAAPAPGRKAVAEAPATAPGKTAGTPKSGGSKAGAVTAPAGGAAASANSTPPPTAPGAKTPAPAAASADAAGGDKNKKVGPKGITIVHPKPSKPSKPKPKFQLPQGEPLLKPGAKWKPLIPSGPGAPPRHDLEHMGPGDGTPIKTKLSKKELEKYRQVLLAKRAELVGDVRNMESEALLQNSGSLSHTPQHMAEQGTDVSDQSLNLDLAAVDRSLIRDIDAALERIEAGTYGICELTGKPISTERLDELPWTRYSIEAARERERRSYQP